MVSASGRPVPYNMRHGNIAQFRADPGLAQQLLGWQAGRGIEQMSADARRSQNGQTASNQQTWVRFRLRNKVT